MQFCSTFSWKRNSLNLNTPLEFLLIVLQSMVFLMDLSFSSSRAYQRRCVCAALFLYDFNPFRTEVQVYERRVATSCIYLNYFYQFNHQILIIRKMDKSNSNSQQSNLFIISSESSRSDNKHLKKENYIKFAKRVKELLDVPGNDLDQLYQKLENIVVKYFQEHKIVDFQEMYAHIASLKSNSLKMIDIVSVLEKRLCRSNSKHEEGRKSSKTQQFQTTINSHKQRNSLHYENVSTSNKEDLLNIFSDTYGQDSVKYNHIFKPSTVKENNHQLTPKVNRSKKENQTSPSNYSSKHSPSKTNIEEYYNRNKQYELRIKQMMKQVHAIKQSIPKQPSSSQGSNLRINLRQNQQKPLERQSSESTKQIQQKIEDNDTNKRLQFKPNEENKTPNSSSYIHELTNITVKENEGSYIENKRENIKKQQNTNQVKQDKINLSLMLKNTQNITKQIQELKQVASRLEIESSKKVLEINQQSETSIYPPEKLNELIRKISEQKNKKQPILQEIQNTTSQVKISQNMIPSFKYLPHQEGNINKEKQIFTTELNMATTKHPVNVSFHEINPGSHSMLSSSQVVNSFKPLAEQQPPYNLSTIKYVYNPYPNPVIYPNHSLYIKPQPIRANQLFRPAPTPIQRAPYQGKDKTIINREANRPYMAQISSPISSSNNSSTSIMHPHLFSRERQNLSLIKQLQDQRSYINPIQKNPINTINSYQSSNRIIGSGKSVQSSSNGQSSTSSLSRKGLNVITHIQKKP